MVPKFILKPGEKVSLSGIPGIPILPPAKCDSHGDIYVRFIGYDDPDPWRSPVTEFSSNGEKLATFSADNAGSWNSGETASFAIGPDGGVYLLADRRGPHRTVQSGILAFDRDGSHRFNALLHLPIDLVHHLAAFSNGNFLIVATRKAKPRPPRIPGAPVHLNQGKGKRPPVQPLAFLVGHDGRLIKKIVLRTSLYLPGEKPKGSALQLKASVADLSSLVTGEDGNTAYLLFQEAEPTIYAISSSGKVESAFQVEPPAPGYGAVGMNWADGLGLLLESAHIVNHGFLAKHMYFSVVDPQTGQRLDDYEGATKLGTSLACFSRQNIFFFSVVKGKAMLQQAEIQ